MLAPMLALLAAFQARPYRPCDHSPDQPGPAATPELQDRTRAEIRAAVDAIGGSATFARYLIIVAARESSLRPGVIHVDEDDSRASAAAYRRLRAAHRAAGNPFADRPELWLTYGLFGMNSNYHGRRLSNLADPRTLCSTKVAVATYALAAQDVLRRMRRCVARPTWGDVHRAVQGGKLCPTGRRSRLPAALAAEHVRAADVGG